MKVEKLIEILGADFYTGVPDSQLKALCDYLYAEYGTDSRHHVIAANEGNCAALAAGYHLATGRVPVVYMQNSGEGNIINPAASLLNQKVYAIPVIFVIGWRGEPGLSDEPQHVFQGEITRKLLEDMEIPSFVIGKETTEEEAGKAMETFRPLLAAGQDVAFVIRKNALSYERKVVYLNENTMTREEVIRHIVKASGEEPVVCTTGKASRELFEIRCANGQSHQYDFLTVGSMGHASSLALGVAISKPERKIWCVDGDGALLMHMGSMAVIGSTKPANLIHIVINNGAHETVGGMPTAAGKIDLTAAAKACGYANAVRVENFEELDRELKAAKERKELSFIEAKCAMGSRTDLGRPTTTALENKRNFMRFLGSGNDTRQIQANVLDRQYRRYEDEYKAAAIAALESGWYILGNRCEQFEKEFASYLGAKYCVGVNSGQDALTLAIRALGIQEGDEVIVPSNTYIATVLGVTENGATPIFVEPDNFYNIDPSRIEAAITKKTKAILAVHLYGQAAAMEEIHEIAIRHHLYLLEDCAQSHGARCKGRMTGTFGDIGCFSFYPTKNLGAFGDAGAVVTDREDLAEKMRLLRNYGSRVKYQNEIEGVNSRLDEIQAALLSVKLSHIQELNEERIAAAQYYETKIVHPQIIKPIIRNGSEHVYHQYVIRCPQRKRLQAYLHEQGVQTQIHYPIPPHRAECYQYLGYGKEDFPIAQQYADEILSLPLYTGITREEQDYVIECLNRFAAE